MISLMLCLGMSAQASSLKWKKASKVYKNFLAKNVSRFEPREGDFWTKNKESYKKTSSFLLADLDKNGVPELLTWHANAYKQYYIYIYTFKNNKMVKVKDEERKDVVLPITSQAAGWYEVYVCSKGHLHTDWSGGWLGTHDTVYTMRSGRLKVYLDGNDEQLINRKTYKLNGKRITQKKYNSLIGKCGKKNKMYFQDNTKKNRAKYLK